MRMFYCVYKHLLQISSATLLPNIKIGQHMT